ncbi:MAG: nitric oxide reductase transcriptional regulator NorR, partial [Spongiibacteraceae bacterium]|nr:nitric oxide reductase transcriptional regulator NorR [Spongiibacteraceae bacterium]
QVIASPQPVRFADDELPDPYDGLVTSETDSLPVHDCLGATLTVDDQPWGVITLDALQPGSFDSVDPGTLATFLRLAEACVRAAVTLNTLRLDLDRERAVSRSHENRRLLAGSAAMRRLEEELAIVAPTDLAVLVLGETGVGKELVAQQLHLRSQRARQPLVQVNCGALPEHLAESELFGHRRGAFTGATEDRRGKFELADGGTLLLDEVGELPLGIQAKLLRVLANGEIQRPGSDDALRVDVRVIAATNRDLRREVAAGRFRADLYHRLSVYPLHVPPLRERGRDVILLAGAFLEENRHRLGVRQLRLSEAARETLLRYDWPGNVRELEHVISRAALRALTQQRAAGLHGWVIIEPDQLGLGAVSAAPAEPAQPEPPVTVQPQETLKEAVDRFQRQWLTQLLAQHDGNLAATARTAGVDRSNLHRLLKRLGLR